MTSESIGLWRVELERAMTELRELAKPAEEAQAPSKGKSKRKGPRPVATRFEVRASFIPLGFILIEDPETAQPYLEELRALSPKLGEHWTHAVQDELTLSAREHIQSVDPKYLGRKGYDLNYTLTARERLEARLRVAEELEMSLPEDLLGQVTEADELLEPFLDQGTGKQP